METKKVIIVGGGAAGLVAAWTLKKQGVDVLLFEAGDEIGGRMGGARVKGFSVDSGVDFSPVRTMSLFVYARSWGCR